MTMTRGTIVFVEPDPVERIVGREQSGPRPGDVLSENAAVVISYNVIALVPVTSSPMSGDFYPVVRRRPDALSRDGYALPEMLRVVDASRVKRRLGRVTPSEMKAIEESLRKWLRLPAGAGPDTVRE